MKILLFIITSFILICMLTVSVFIADYIRYLRHKKRIKKIAGEYYNILDPGNYKVNNKGELVEEIVKE